MFANEIPEISVESASSNVSTDLSIADATDE